MSYELAALVNSSFFILHSSFLIQRSAYSFTKRWCETVLPSVTVSR